MDKMEEIKKPDLNREETEILIKSIVIATKRDVIVSSLNNEFKKQAGYHIRYESFGYTSLEKFLESVEGVTLELNCYGSNVVKVETINSRHIRELVRNQKSPVKRRKKRNKSAPGRTGTYEDSPPGNLEKAKCKSIYKSHTNLSSESSEKFEEKEARLKNKTTTMNPDEDTRSYPFVVINQESDIENVEDLEENGVTELKLKPKLCGLRSSAFDQNKRRKIEDTKCVRFEPDAEECEECTCPALAQYTLVGDDWFFNLAKDVLKSFVCKTPFGEMIGINKKKLTIFDATKYLSLRKYLPEKIVLLIGATDLLEGKLFEVIAYDMYGLIGQILKQNITLAVCTIPPIFSKKIHNKEIYSNFLKFNELIKCIPEDYNDSVEIIDLYALFTRGSDLKMNFRLNEYFCPENDEGCIPKMNEKGKKLLKTILVSYLS